MNLRSFVGFVCLFAAAAVPVAAAEGRGARSQDAAPVAGEPASIIYPKVAAEQTRAPLPITATTYYNDWDTSTRDATSCTKNQMCESTTSPTSGKCVSETESGTGCKKSGTNCFDCK